MAIYNNQEVIIQDNIKLEKMYPDVVTVYTKNGQSLQAKIGAIYFTDAELKTIEKNDSVELKKATAEDLEAVRAGIAPPSRDLDLKQRAENDAGIERSNELSAKYLEKAKADAKVEQDVENKVKDNQPKNAVNPMFQVKNTPVVK